MTVSTFDELQDVIAWIGYRNPAHEIFLRGQTHDYRAPNSRLHESLLTPSILRPPQGKKGLSPKALGVRLNVLEHYKRHVVTIGSRQGVQALKQHDAAIWALLQHYQLAPTPLFDVTRSARVAATFATLGKPEDDGYVYALALPYMTGNITFDFANDVVMLSLRNLMPPDAKRPHYQEGYLIGTLSALKLTPREQNWSRRLLAKIRIPSEAKPTFFSKGNPALPYGVLFPSEDPVAQWVASFPSVLVDPWLGR